ncbi:MAG TPA: NAD-dependent 4,6-dehydratase LegB [Methylibium sp.]|nr:NAD-dependent 4,6-dehydratase LegB [Methylibium sp.]
MQLAGQRILVTGADGFIGSHLVEHLVALGCDVRAFVLYNSFNSWGWLDESPPEVRRSIDVFAGDIRDPHGVHTAMQGCDVVLHLAALIAIPYSYHSPDTYVDTNVKGTLNILQAARALGVKRVVHTSTSEVYGTARFVPITEEHPLQGQSPYSASKIAADQMAYAFHASFELPVTTIRPFNTYGPRQSARAVIPTVITQIANGAHELQLGALHPTRDFNFVRDTCRGFVAVAEADAALGEVVNIGSNYEVSIGDTVRLIAEEMGAEVAVRSADERLRPEASEVERLWADNDKARRLCGWTPEYAGVDGLRRGLRETIAWFREPEHLRRYKADRYNI